MNVKFGDILFNGYASERNPIRKSIVVYVTSTYIKCVCIVDGKLKEVTYSKYDVEQTEEDKFKVIGHVDLVEYINNVLNKYELC